jgi:hypothetical protein
MLPSQAVEVDRRMLDVQHDRSFTIQEEDVVGVASGQPPGSEWRCQSVRLDNGR